MTNKEYWGYHLRLDAGACDKQLVAREDYVGLYNQSLLKLIDMKPMDKPWIKNCGPADRPDLCGVTLLQPIETSCITAHFCDTTGDAYVDLFSCKEFSVQAVVDHFNEWFAPSRMSYDYKTRQA
jgi:hypothetical protein